MEINLLQQYRFFQSENNINLLFLIFKMENNEIMELAKNLHEKNLAASMTDAIEKAKDILQGSKNMAQKHSEYRDENKV